MGLTFFKTRRSAHEKKQDGKTAAIEAGPRPSTSRSTSSSRPHLSPNPLALNPPNRLHFIPRSKGQDETARVLSGDKSAVNDLSQTIGKAGRLSKTVPELNLGGLGATERWLKTGGADQQVVSELLNEQTRAEDRLRDLENRRSRAGFTLMTDESLIMLPATSFRASIKTAAPELFNSKSTTDLLNRKSSFDMVLEQSLAEYSSIVVEAGCDTCKASFEMCNACYGTTKRMTGCDQCRDGQCKARRSNKLPCHPRSRNPSSERLARLNKRPVPLTYNPASHTSICSSLLPETPATPEASASLWYDSDSLASLSGELTEGEDEDVVEVLEVKAIGVILTARVVDIGGGAASSSSHVKPLTLRSRLAVPSDRPQYHSRPAVFARLDSPTMPTAIPAPLFSKRK